MSAARPVEWQEIECPRCKLDFDLEPPELLSAGDMARCVHCHHEWSVVATDMACGPVDDGDGDDGPGEA